MGTDGIVVRERLAGDVGAAVSVLARVHAVDGYPVEGRHVSAPWLLRGGAVAAWVAEADGAVAGHAALVRPPAGGADALWAAEHPADADRIVSLARLFVSPAARGRALGGALVRTAEEYARAHGLVLVLDVMAKDTAAIALYERRGWREFARTTFFLGGEHVPARCFAAPAAG